MAVDLPHYRLNDIFSDWIQHFYLRSRQNGSWLKALDGGNWKTRTYGTKSFVTP
ncbi:hypothetical protein PAMP_013129 [Pampus punctatissimus]